MSHCVDLHRGPCPTCGGIGSLANPFDANCSAEWAHRFIANAGGVSAHDMEAARALATMGRAGSDTERGERA